MIRRSLLVALVSFGLAAPAAALPVVTVSRGVLTVGETVVLDLAFDAGSDAHAGFLLHFEASPSLELLSFTPVEADSFDSSADLAAGLFSFARTLPVTGTGRFHLGQVEVRALGTDAALRLRGSSGYIADDLRDRYFEATRLASTTGGGPAHVVAPPPPAAPPLWYGNDRGAEGVRAPVIVVPADPIYLIDSPFELVSVTAGAPLLPILLAPEPASALLLASGLALLARGRPRR